MADTQKTLITVSGPTAIGKTAMAIKLATHFGTEIISADSRQFYKEMSIGTAVPDTNELAEAKHHFIQHISIHNPYNVGDYEKEAIAKINNLFKENDILIMAGGSGLYIKAVLEGLDTFPKTDPEIRKKLKLQFEQKGLAPLQEHLLKLDPYYYENADIQNPQRVIRALEVSIQGNKPYSSYLQKQQKTRYFNSLHLALNAPREIIYERINLRVDKMIKEGLEEEVRALYPFKNLNALQTVGYKELFEYLEGNCSLETAISEIKKNTRRYAKRQLTWLRKDSSVLWLEYDTGFDTVLEKIQKKMKLPF